MDLSIQWPLVVFSLLAGSGGALTATCAVSELTGRATKARFSALICSLVLLVVGGLASILHLASPQNVMAAAANLLSFSGISVELIMLGITFIVIAVYAVMVRRSVAAGGLKVIAVISLICGCVLAFVCGHGYVIDARALWDTELLPLAYLGSVLPVGVFGYEVLGVLAKEETDELLKLKHVAAASALLSILSMLGYVVYLELDVAMRDQVVFWGGIVICGIVIVAVCTCLLYCTHAKQHFTTIVVVGLIAAFIGALSLRILMWVASDAFMNLFGLASTMHIL